MQGDPIIEPHVYATLRLNKAYQFEPVPKEQMQNIFKADRLIYGQNRFIICATCNIWYGRRAFAIAESVWSPKEKKNWDNFSSRVEKQFARFDAAEIKYAPSMYDPDF